MTKLPHAAFIMEIIKDNPLRPERTQCSEQPEDTQNSQDLSSSRHGHHNINQRHEDQEAIQDVPTTPEICCLSEIQTHGHHLWR